MLRTELDIRPYQISAIDWIKRKPASGLLVAMGLGKTVVTQTALADLLRGTGADRPRGMLVIAPKRVCESVWKQESREWDHLNHLRFASIMGSAKRREQVLRKARADIYLMNVDNLPWLAVELRAMQRSGLKLPFDWLVVDESSMLKDHTTKRFRAIRAILPAFTRRNILTGTPTPNSLLELWPQVFVLDQGRALGNTFIHYRDRYFEMDEAIGRWVPKRGGTAAVYRAVAHLTLRMDNKDLAGLPAVIENEIRFELPPAARRVYDQMERSMFVQLDLILEQMRAAGQRGFVEAVNKAVLTGKTHQIANGAVFDSEDRSTWHEVHKARLEVLEEVLSEIKTPVMIAYTYRHDRERLLKLLGPDTPVIGGGNKDTDIIAQRWNAGEYPYLLAHPRSASHGLNLQKGPGHTVIWFSRLWSLELFDQLIARIARSGQSQPHVYVHSFTANNTVDEVMRDEIIRKAAGQRVGLDILREYQQRRMATL